MFLCFPQRSAASASSCFLSNLEQHLNISLSFTPFALRQFDQFGCFVVVSFLFVSLFVLVVVVLRPHWSLKDMKAKHHAAERAAERGWSCRSQAAISVILEYFPGLVNICKSPPTSMLHSVFTCSYIAKRIRQVRLRRNISTIIHYKNQKYVLIRTYIFYI